MKNLPKLSYEEALDLLNRAIAEKGADYVYQRTADDDSCAYFKNGEPSCIVGHVLAYKGVTQEDLPENKNTAIVIALRIAQDDRTERLLDSAQSYQDTGTPWGDAVKSALEDTQDNYEEGEDV
jgi:hypothetical protein